MDKLTDWAAFEAVYLPTLQAVAAAAATRWVFVATDSADIIAKLSSLDFKHGALKPLLSGGTAALLCVEDCNIERSVAVWLKISMRSLCCSCVGPISWLALPRRPASAQGWGGWRLERRGSGGAARCMAEGPVGQGRCECPRCDC